MMLGWPMELGPLRQESREFETEVDEIIGRNPQAVSYVRQLETRLDENSSDDLPPMQANEMLMRDLDDFLRRGREKPRGDA
jgi:hypothetical protein